jgi:hypothetical protein
MYHRPPPRICRAPRCLCDSPCEAYEREEQESDQQQCRGPEDFCDGCPECTDTVETSKVVTARAPRTEEGRKRRARNGIKPGDLIRVTRGFKYQTGGPRLGYFQREVRALTWGHHAPAVD